MLHPDVFFYHLNGMGAQKVISIFFLHTVYVKTKRNSWQILINQNIFKKHKYASPNA